MEFLSFIQNNFTHAAPVLIAGLVAIAICIERVRTLVYVYPLHNARAFFEKITELVNRDQNSQAVALCDQYIDKPVARVVKSALMRGHLPDEAIEQGVSITIAEVSQLITRRTAFLATIANVSTLMGLFGTIVGLIASFQAVASADPAQKSALLSAGISTAMNATMLGLGVAIPCMLAFAFLMNRSNKLTGEVEEAALKTMDVLKMRFFNHEASEAKKAI